MDSVTCVVGAVGIEKKSTAIKSCKQKRWDRPTKTTVTSVVYVSKPQAVADVIEKAVRGAAAK